jgi:hypothetical protein
MYFMLIIEYIGYCVGSSLCQSLYDHSGICIMLTWPFLSYPEVGLHIDFQALVHSL